MKNILFQNIKLKIYSDMLNTIEKNIYIIYIKTKIITMIKKQNCVNY